VLAMAIDVTFVTGVLFSLAPMWRVTGAAPNVALQGAARSTLSAPKLLPGKSLVAVQVALCLVLLAAAGLFVRTLSNLKSARLGFRPERILLFTIDPPRTAYDGERRIAFFERIEEGIAGIPGLQSGTLSSVALVGGDSNTTRAVPEWRAQRPGDQDRAWVNDVGDHFFQTMGIPILYGRPIGSQDRSDSIRVAVVNQRFVREFFPQGGALAKTFRSSGTAIHIVGICGDARYNRIQAGVQHPHPGAADR
jgi:hypothetical protein